MGLFQIKISLSLLLLLQLLYCFLGIGFNGVSYLRTRFGGQDIISEKDFDRNCNYCPFVLSNQAFDN